MRLLFPPSPPRQPCAVAQPFGSRSWAYVPLLGLLAAVALEPEGLSAAMMPDAVRIPVIKEHPGDIPPDAALFRHGTHATFVCAVCHPATFPAYPLGFTHKEMNEGRFCATCHDGKASTAIAEMTCEACHAKP